MTSIINSFRFPAVPIFPSDYANLQRWYKADSFSLSDGDAIGGSGREWVDSANAHNLTQATSGNRPVYHTNVFGTAPAITFTAASSHFLTMPLLTLPTAGLFTIVVIGSSNNDNIILGTDSAGNGNCQVRFRHASPSNIVFFFAGVGSDSGVFTNAQNAVRATTWKRTDASGTIAFRDNKIALSASNGDNNEVNFTQVSGTFGLYTNGSIAEICIWSAAHSDAAMDALYDSYFKPKYGLP